MSVTPGTPGAESHLMRRRPPGGDGHIVYSLEDLLAPGEPAKAVVELVRDGERATVVGGGVPPEHRGHGYGRRLGRQVITDLRADGCRRVDCPEPADRAEHRMLTDLGFVPDGAGLLRLDL